MELPPAQCMYAIVCSQSTKLQWSTVHRSLIEKYHTKWPGRVKEVVYTDGDLLSALPRLSELKPTYTCFLAHHTECDKRYVQKVHKLTREIDPTNPYSDTIWGILTGLEEEDCLHALTHDPLTITRVVGNCPIPLGKFSSGVWFSETEQSVAWRKFSDGPVCRESCAPDITEVLLGEIGANRTASLDEGIDMIITSGHATESELNLGYSFKSGQIRCQDGHLYGHPLGSDKQKIVCHDKAPKVLSAAGNCLMGHIPSPDCMALAWMHSAGVTQMLGYVVPTWYGYGGWGVHKYFINNPGNMSFAQSYFANQQSLFQKLHSLEAPKTVINSHEHICRTHFGVTHDDPSSHEMSGLAYDEDTTVFYGDPAWEAKLLPNPELWDYSITIDKIAPLTQSTESGDKWNYYLFKVETLHPGEWDCSTGDDKTMSPGRPPVYIFPTRVLKAKLIKGNAVVTCNFVMMVLEGCFTSGEVFEVIFAICV